MPTARLGGGTANNTSILRGDQVYATLQAGTSGTDIGVATSASALTINVPDASATARGVVTTGAQTFAGAKTFRQIAATGVADVVEIDVTPFSSQTVSQQIWRNTSAAIVSLIDAAGRPVFGQNSWTVNSAFHSVMWSGGARGWAATSVNSTTAMDTAMHRDGAAGAIGLRNSATPHDVRIYNTYSSASVYERGNIGFVGNVFTIGSYQSGGLSLRGINLGVSGNSIGLYGATPVARATTAIAAAAFVANTGTAVNDASTFGGYTLRQMAQALISLGVLT